jgi:isopentenyl diphosphate isomerase/L-lactate dehydrogenase-like FMN-dependent dehydrogenase
MARAARAAMPSPAWAYLRGGADSVATARRTRQALDAVTVMPRVLQGADDVDTSVELLGTRWPHVIALAPIGLQGLFHAGGEVEAVGGAAAAMAPFTISTVSTRPIEDIAAAANGAPLWFQLYLQQDDGTNRALIQRAEAAGCRALLVTVDTPTLAGRRWQQRIATDLGACDYPNLPGGVLALRAMTWADVDRVLAVTRLPVVLKGVLGAADAVRAWRTGVSGVVVSTHGGRNVGGVPTTPEVLPSIADAVGGRISILADGGIRRGRDVLAMVALGADAVLVGRPYVYGLHLAGAEGVCRAIDILREELAAAMTMLGRPTLRALKERDARWPASAPALAAGHSQEG